MASEDQWTRWQATAGGVDKPTASSVSVIAGQESEEDKKKRLQELGRDPETMRLATANVNVSGPTQDGKFVDMTGAAANALNDPRNSSALPSGVSALPDTPTAISSFKPLALPADTQQFLNANTAPSPNVVLDEALPVSSPAPVAQPGKRQKAWDPYGPANWKF